MGKVGWEEHPEALKTSMNIAGVYYYMGNFRKVDESMEKALMSCEAQLGKDNDTTKICVANFGLCLEESGNSSRLAELKEEYPWL